MTKCLTYKSSSPASLAPRWSLTASPLPRVGTLFSAVSPISATRRLSSTPSWLTSTTWPGMTRWTSSSGPCWLNTLILQGKKNLRYHYRELASSFVCSLEKLEPAATTIINMKSKNKKSVLSTSLGASIILTLILKASLDTGKKTDYIFYCILILR